MVPLWVFGVVKIVDRMVEIEPVYICCYALFFHGHEMKQPPRGLLSDILRYRVEYLHSIGKRNFVNSAVHISK